MPRKRIYWVRDEAGRFAIRREQPAPAEQPPDDQQPPPNADGGPRSDRPPMPPDMNELIRARFSELRGGAFDWQRGHGE